MSIRTLLALAVLLPCGLARAETAAELLARYDKLMGPAAFEATATMTAHREDGSERTYKMKLWKAGDDKFRAVFLEPSSAKGQEMLRVGDNFWIYMPNLKRALRLAARQDFMGGDFNNADVLRVNYTADYDAKVAEETAEHWQLECRAKKGVENVAYDLIKLWIHKGDFMPLKAQYFVASGAMVRSAEFKEPKEFTGIKRPSIVNMKNEVVPARHSEFKTLELKLVDSLPETMFTLGALGK